MKHLFHTLCFLCILHVIASDSNECYEGQRYSDGLGACVSCQDYVLQEDPSCGDSFYYVGYCWDEDRGNISCTVCPGGSREGAHVSEFGCDCVDDTCPCLLSCPSGTFNVFVIHTRMACIFFAINKSLLVLSPQHMNFFYFVFFLMSWVCSDAFMLETCPEV
jgi:hypothetical protein